MLSNDEMTTVVSIIIKAKTTIIAIHFCISDIIYFVSWTLVEYNSSTNIYYDLSLQTSRSGSAAVSSSSIETNSLQS